MCTPYGGSSCFGGGDRIHIYLGIIILSRPVSVNYLNWRREMYLGRIKVSRPFLGTKGFLAAHFVGALCIRKFLMEVGLEKSGGYSPSVSVLCSPMEDCRWLYRWIDGKPWVMRRCIAYNHYGSGQLHGFLVSVAPPPNLWFLTQLKGILSNKFLAVRHVAKTNAASDAPVVSCLMEMNFAPDILTTSGLVKMNSALAESTMNCLTKTNSLSDGLVASHFGK